MRFYVSSAFLDSREVVEIARAADELGYDGMGIPDHVVNLETLQTPYPYTHDGRRRWEPFTHWPDPWVLVGALASVTERLRFVTTVYIPAMRDPYSAAKAIGTAAYLADGRVELGVGVGWCEEEFTLMGQRFDRRGRRTDEMLELFRTLWQPGWNEFSGEFYSAPRLEMEPTPPHIPIYVGGLSDIALRRAARNDGWIGDLISTDRAIASVDKMREMRAQNGLSMDGFTVLTPLTDAFTPEHYARAEAAGITGIITMPWMFYAGPQASPAEKIDGMKRFRKDLGLDCIVPVTAEAAEQAAAPHGCGGGSARGCGGAGHHPPAPHTGAAADAPARIDGPGACAESGDRQEAEAVQQRRLAPLPPSARRPKALRRTVEGAASAPRSTQLPSRPPR